MLLVGSRALEYYMTVNRVLHDWDIWMTESEFKLFHEVNSEFMVKQTLHTTVYDIHGKIVEIKDQSKFEPTDHKIFNLSHFNLDVETPWGKASVPSLQIIYDMKKATQLCIDEWKHRYDLKLIEDFCGDQLNRDTDLFFERFTETNSRILKSDQKKYEFFHKNAMGEHKIATIPEYIEHDRLHELIADLANIAMPTYLRITNGDVSVDINLFNNLPHRQKLLLMVEESLVLALERWFIPQMVEKGINYKLIDRFYSNNEASGSYLLLKHVNIKGLIGEHPEITQFGRDNFAEIEKLWIEKKEVIKENGGFPKWFYDEIFQLREKYRNGEKVGLHHGK